MERLVNTQCMIWTVFWISVWRQGYEFNRRWVFGDWKKWQGDYNESS
jgi:hypothetical protein